MKEPVKLYGITRDEERIVARDSVKGLQDRQNQPPQWKFPDLTPTTGEKLDAIYMERGSWKRNTPHRKRARKKLKITQINRQWRTLWKRDKRFRTYIEKEEFGSSSYRSNKRVKFKSKPRVMKKEKTKVKKFLSSNTTKLKGKGLGRRLLSTMGEVIGPISEFKINLLTPYDRGRKVDF